MAKSNISTTGLSLAFLSLCGVGVLGQQNYAYAQTVNNAAETGVQETGLVFGANDDALLSDPLNQNLDQQTQSIGIGNVGTDINNPIQNTNSQLRAARATAIGSIANPNDPSGGSISNPVVSPTQSGTGRVERTAPFAAQGFRLGSFNGNASLEQAIGFSDNLTQAPNGPEGGFSETNLNISLASDFSRHQILANLMMDYDRSLEDENLDTFLMAGTTSLRLDLLEGVTLTSLAGYTAQTQSSTDTSLTTGSINTPLREMFTASTELASTAQKLQFLIRGSIERIVIEDADLGGGLIQNQDDQSRNLYRLTTRLGYEISPAITPFIESTFGVREYDLQFDRNGNQRDSELFQLRAGIDLDMGEKLNGEISAGYTTEEFKDPALENIEGYTISTALNWSPKRDTQYILTLGTGTNSSTSLNESGTLIYNTRLDYQKQITSRFAINTFADYQTETNNDDNRTLSVGLGAEYFLNRNTALTADLEYTDFTSNDSSDDYNETRATIGILLQK